MRKYGGEWKTRKHTFFKERSFYECDILDGTGARPGGATPRPRSGALAALCWSSREGIPHVQGKRNPSKTVGTERASEGRQTETTIIENEQI